jgi:hypothetical protein
MARLKAWYRAWRRRRTREWIKHGRGIGIINELPKPDSRDKQAEFYKLIRGK